MLQVQLVNADGVARTLNTVPALFNRAARSTVLRMAQRVEKGIEQRIATELALPKAGIGRYRVKSKRKGNVGLVWAGYNPVKAAYAGRLRQHDWGASAGQYLFPGGFIATMPSRHRGIFKRKSDRSLPIQEMTVSMLKVPDLARQEIVGPTREEYLEELRRQIAAGLARNLKGQLTS